MSILPLSILPAKLHKLIEPCQMTFNGIGTMSAFGSIYGTLAARAVSHRRVRTRGHWPQINTFERPDFANPMVKVAEPAWDSPKSDFNSTTARRAQVEA